MLVCKAKDGEANEQITNPALARTAAATKGAAVSAKKKKISISHFQSSSITPRCVSTQWTCPARTWPGVSPCEFPRERADAALAGTASQTRMEPVSRSLGRCPALPPTAPWPWLWVCLRSHGTPQNRLLLIAQDSEPGEEGALVVVVGQEMVVVVLMSG